MSNSSFQKFNNDDDLLVTCFSNDAHSTRLSKEESIRVFWETKLPMRLDFSKEDWEVALVNFSCRNRERLDVELVVSKTDDANFRKVLPLPTGIYDSSLEAVSEAYTLLNSERVHPSPPFVGLSGEELHCLWHDEDAKNSVFKGRHYIVSNENFAPFVDSDESKFDRIDIFLNYLRDARCVKLDAGTHGSSTFADSHRLVFLQQHSFKPDGTEKLEKVGIGSRNYEINNSRSPNWSTSFTIILTKKLALLCHLYGRVSFDKVYYPWNPFGYSVRTDFYTFNSGNKEFVAVSFNTKLALEFNLSSLTLRDDMPAEIISPVPMLSCKVDRENDKLTFKKGDDKTVFSLAYNPPTHTHEENLIFQDGPISDLSRFAPSPIPSSGLPLCRFVKVRVMGLNLKDAWTMKGWEDESDVAVFSVKIPREKKTISFTPFRHKENYVPIQTSGCNALRISVEFDDGFSPQTSRPKFYVGATSVTLKFREKWKAGADFTRRL